MITKTYQIAANLEACIRQKIKDVEILAANEYKKVITERVFKFGLDADNRKLGSYRSESYKKKRQKEGRQINYKDLQMTDEFRNDLDIGEFDGKTAVGFTSERSETIVRGQEKQLDIEIFSTNEEEVEIVFENIEPELDNIIRECLNNL